MRCCWAGATRRCAPVLQKVGRAAGQREPYAVQLRGARICALGLPRSACTLPTSCACSNLPLAVDFGSDSSIKLLLTELTGAGFDPSERCCVVAEGLLPFLSQVGGWAHRLACKTNVDSCARAGTSAGCWDATYFLLQAIVHCSLHVAEAGGLPVCPELTRPPQTSYLVPAAQEQTSGVLADLCALAAPGSRLLFDFLHAGKCGTYRRAVGVAAVLVAVACTCDGRAVQPSRPLTSASH